MNKVISFGKDKGKPLIYMKYQFNYYGYLYHNTNLFNLPQNKYIRDYFLNEFGNIINNDLVKRNLIKN